MANPHKSLQCNVTASKSRVCCLSAEAPYRAMFSKGGCIINNDINPSHYPQPRRSVPERSSDEWLITWLSANASAVLMFNYASGPPLSDGEVQEDTSSPQRHQTPVCPVYNAPRAEFSLVTTSPPFSFLFMPPKHEYNTVSAIADEIW